ncbi:MAG: hypothetical protein JWQ66_1770 [Mucilaginibacter sp.]|nr:hypothetical protein [Mucilaginibacter sp.]
MERIKPLSDFFRAIRKDARINTTHIGIYAALLQYWQENECQNPLSAFSYEVMRIAKVSAQATYHRSVRDLHSFGYIRYEPSFKRNSRSKIYLLSINNE